MNENKKRTSLITSSFFEKEFENSSPNRSAFFGAPMAVMPTSTLSTNLTTVWKTVARIRPIRRDDSPIRRNDQIYDKIEK